MFTPPKSERRQTQQSWMAIRRRAGTFQWIQMNILLSQVQFIVDDCLREDGFLRIEMNEPGNRSEVVWEVAIDCLLSTRC